MGFRTNFRDKQEWLRSTQNGIDLNTTSDEACKYYDACLTQFLGWYDDHSLDGLVGSVDRMVKADPEFLLGRAMELEFELLGGMKAIRMDKELSEKLVKFNSLMDMKRPLASEQELLHAEVVNFFAQDEYKKASRVLERLNSLYPEDLVALKMLQDNYFFLGQVATSRGAVAHTLSKINVNGNPLAGYVHGMFSFALEEANMYPQAQEQALEAIKLIPNETWAIHNYAHCLEMLGKTKEGIKWMLNKKADWLPCSVLSSHQYWHTALFHINNDNFDEAVYLLDNEVLPRCHKTGVGLDLHDSCSIIYRMELVDLFGKTSKAEPGSVHKHERWDAIYEFCKTHTRDHLNGFNDAHYMMGILGKGDLDMARQLIQSVDDSPMLVEGKTVVKPLLEAMLEFKLGHYEKCVDLLEPIRFDIVKIGGSHAQRDVFEQLIIVSALRSSKVMHNKLAQRMLSEREIYHGRQTTQTKLLADAKLR